MYKFREHPDRYFDDQEFVNRQNQIAYKMNNTQKEFSSQIHHYQLRNEQSSQV